MALRLLQLASLLALIHCGTAQNNFSVILDQAKDRDNDLSDDNMQTRTTQLPVNSQEMGKLLQMILAMLKDTNMVMVNKRPEEPTRDSGATNATDSSEPAAKLKASQIAAIPITKAFDAGETPTTAKTGTIRKVADDIGQKADAITYHNNDTGVPQVPHIAKAVIQPANIEQNASTPITSLHQNEQPSATYVNNTGSGSTNGSEAEIPDTGFQNATNANKTDSDLRAGSQTEVEEQSTSGSEVSSESAGSEDEEEDTSKEESTDSSTKIDETSTAMTLPLSAIFLPVEAVIAIFIVI
ncbi:unnamed protein product [Albugo candida]|uniref:RxLR effector protein n=1 Tax=Albugo candida TaxID=65357 RepID=A0A024FTM0_9STRA|nr:unnamed protein product [Albugo candida]|eukprot:CCI10460.1 unnamed protein product [Albugo candida]